MAFSEKRLLARKMRKMGHAIKSIAVELGVAKSTVSIWCRDIILTEKQIHSIMKKSNDALFKGRMIGAEMNRQKRLASIDASIQKASLLIDKVSKRDMLVAATALYWAEGAKSQYTSGFQFVNSDLDMIVLMNNFLLNFGVKKEDICCTVQINEVHKPRIAIVLNFWKNLLEFNDEQIGNPSFIVSKAKKRYENHDTYFGICRLKVRKSTALKYTMLALIKVLKNDIVMPV